ncbi:MAG: L-lactate permease [Anaerolineales bacterium]|nr:L-lactate permease [Anaerolineales bacterium]
MPILASIPILVILVLMIGYRWGAARAGAAGYLAAFFVAITFFGAGADVLAFAHTKAIILSVDVLLIIWAAFILYRVAEDAGAIKTIGRLLPSLTRDRGMQALLIGWVFASFLQGAGGFGVPVAVTAPLLIGLGFTPLSAVIIPSIGHGWAVTFGSLGSSFNALLSATGLDARVLAPDSALYLGLACVLTGPMIAHAADGWSGVKRLLVPALVIGTVMGTVQFTIAVGAGLWNLGAFAGGLAGLAVSMWVARWRGAGKGVERSERKPLFLALSAYLILILFTTVILLIPTVKDWLGQASIQIQFPETVTALGFVSPAGTNRPIHIFTHAGAILVYTSLVSFFIYRRAGLYKAGAGKNILRGTIKSMMSSSLSIVLMVAMASLMQGSGMTEAMAQGLADAAGKAFPLIAPWIGGIGAFMTGSNTNSNVVFAGLQMRTAELLAYSVPAILAGQTAGAAVASVAAPAKVVVGVSTAGMAGKEGDVLRALVGYTALLVMFIGFLTGLASLLGF